MILSSLIPKPSCVICGKTEERICSECKKFLKSHEDLCPICHHYSPYGKVCPSCQAKFSPPFEGISVSLKTTPPIRKLLIKFKYRHLKDISRFFANFLLREVKRNPFLMRKTFVLSFVPSHRTKTLFKRGYSQAHLLAKNLSTLLKVELIQTCIKIKNVKSQLLLNKYQREKNVQGAFKSTRSINLNNIDYLIVVDDILTTGATITEVSKCIKNTYPGLKIRGVVLGRYA